MKKRLIHLFVCLIAIMLFSQCEKDSFADYPLNPLDPDSDSLVFEITSGTCLFQSVGNYTTNIKFEFYSPDVVSDKKNLLIILIKDGIIVDNAPWYYTGDFTGKVVKPGTYKYEIALFKNGYITKKSKPCFLTCQ